MSPLFRKRGESSEVYDQRIEQAVEEHVEAVKAEFHPLHAANYEPVFPRLSVTRRVLGHITPEVDRDDLGPRNTLNALTVGVIADPHTEISHPEQVPPYLADLVKAGLASLEGSPEDGVYTVTDAGWRELMN